MAEYDLSGINVPCNIDAEQSVLGAVLMDSSAMSELATVLQPDHFYVALNRSVYGVMLNMYLAGDKIDIVTVLDAVMRQNIFENPGAGEGVPRADNDRSSEYLHSRKIRRDSR